MKIFLREVNRAIKIKCIYIKVTLDVAIYEKHKPSQISEDEFTEVVMEKIWIFKFL